MRITRTRAAIALGVIAASTIIVRGTGLPDAAAAGTVTYNANVFTLVNGVSRAQLEPVVRDLSGEQATTVGGQTYTFSAPRYSNNHVPGQWSAPIDKAEQYMYEKMAGYGLSSVKYQVFPGDGNAMNFPEGRNVIGQITGTTRPSQIVVVGCHLDVMNDASWPKGSAPGADDNASGCSALLYMARTMASYKLDRTVRFIAFDAEENAPWSNGGNTVGSGYNAAQSKLAKENIVGMIQMDGLAYNPVQSAGAVMEMHVRKSTADAGGIDLAMYTMWRDAITTYGITGFVPTKIQQCTTNVNCGSFWSDNGSFWRWGGYHAVWLVEEEWGNNYNPNWHTPNDRISTFDWTQYVGATKSLVALTAHQVGVIGPK